MPALKRLENNKLHPEVAKFHNPTLFTNEVTIVPQHKKQIKDEYRIESLF